MEDLRLATGRRAVARPKVDAVEIELETMTSMNAGSGPDGGGALLPG